MTEKDEMLKAAQKPKAVRKKRAPAKKAEPSPRKAGDSRIRENCLVRVLPVSAKNPALNQMDAGLRRRDAGKICVVAGISIHDGIRTLTMQNATPEDAGHMVCLVDSSVEFICTQEQFAGMTPDQRMKTLGTDTTNTEVA